MYELLISDGDSVSVHGSTYLDALYVLRFFLILSKQIHILTVNKSLRAAKHNIGEEYECYLRYGHPRTE